MEALFEIQLPVMIFFQSIASAALDIIAQVITVFGESSIPLLVTIFIYWCIDKKKGYMIIASLLSALMSMQIIKAILRIPRPFMKYPEYIQGKRQSTATGFSFPSGHSTTASSFYSSLAYNFKSKTLRVICILLIILVPFSRLYLGVHWPMDVIVGTLIGLFFSLMLANAFSKMYENDEAFITFSAIFAIASVTLSFSLSITMDVMSTNYQNIEEFKALTFYRTFGDLMQTSALAAGIFFGFIADRHFLKFESAKTSWDRFFSLFVGLLSAMIVVYILSMIPIFKFTFKFITYFFVGLWTTYLFPLIATKEHWMKRGEIK